MGIWIGGDDVWIVWNNDDNNNLSLIFVLCNLCFVFNDCSSLFLVQPL